MTGSTGRVVTLFQIFQSALGNFCLRGGTPLHAMCAQHMQLGARRSGAVAMSLAGAIGGKAFFLAKLG